MTTEPIAALLSGEPQPPSRADDAAQDQLSPLDAVAEAVTKLDPDRGDVCGGGGERNPGHETEQELDLF